MNGDLKRPAPPHHSPLAKRHQSPLHVSSQEQSDLHIRALMEPAFCARILGARGHKLRDLRWASDENKRLNAWLTPDEGFEYRVLHVTGSPLTVAKFFGLIVRAIHDEGHSPSGHDSHMYDLKVLVPHPLMGKLIGTRMAVFKDIELKSAAQLSADRDKLPHCDDRVVHVYGVGDAVHIAVFHICEIFANNVSTFRASRLIEYAPGPEPIDRKHAHHNNSNGLSDDNTLMGPPPPRINSFTSGRQAPPLPPLFSRGSQPSLDLPDEASIQLQTAFETAKESKRPSLRQIIKVPTDRPKKGLDTLIDNMQRVTTCTIKIVDEDDCAIQIDGPPEDNTLAIFLAYRYARSDPNPGRASNPVLIKDEARVRDEII